MATAWLLVLDRLLPVNLPARSTALLLWVYALVRHLRAGCLQACRLLRHANGEGNEDREIVLRARESGKVVLTAPFKLLNDRIGVILTYAAYKSAVGYLGGIFDMLVACFTSLQQANNPSW